MINRKILWVVAVVVLSPTLGMFNFLLTLIDLSEAFGPTDAIGISVAVGASASCGTVAAILVWQLPVKGDLNQMFLLPIAFLPALAGWLPWGYPMIGSEIGLVCALWGLGRVTPSQLRAAACCGVAPPAVFFRVVLRPILSQVVAGALLSTFVAIGMRLSVRIHSFETPPVNHLPYLAQVSLLVLMVSLLGAGLALLRRPQA